MSRILAIGGTGFIGRFASAQLLEMGNEVTVFHRGASAGIAGAASLLGERREMANLRSKLRAARPDVVIDFLVSNERQAIELVEIFQGYAGRVVMLSSCDVYRAVGIFHGTEPGEPDNTIITEDTPVRTRLHPYPPAAMRVARGMYPWLEEEYDKIPAERAILASAGLPGTILRLPMIYGPGDPGHRLMPVIKRVDDGRTVMLLDEGTAQWRAIRGYVEDVAWAVALAATDARAAGRVYNVGDQENYTELEWRRQIAEAAGWTGRFVLLTGDRMPAHLKPRGNVRQHWPVDSSRIRRELGYREQVSREHALARTIAWERAHPPAEINPAEYDYAAEDAAM